jgi:hypothetical protein
VQRFCAETQAHFETLVDSMVAEDRRRARRAPGRRQHCGAVMSAGNVTPIPRLRGSRPANETEAERVREACRAAGQAFTARKLEQLVEAAMRPPEPPRLVVDNKRRSP